MWRTIDTNTITIAHGSAGTGKTLVALWKGLAGVKEGRYDRVYYIRSDERRGVSKRQRCSAR